MAPLREVSRAFHRHFSPISQPISEVESGIDLKGSWTTIVADFVHEILWDQDVRSVDGLLRTQTQ